jgi:raffinose/stachyose/melibiose transport system substrate-binding protein
MKRMVKIVSVAVMSAVLISLTGCSKKSEKSSSASLSYTDVELGKSYSGITAEIKLLTHRTDLLQPDYSGRKWSEYIEEFNKLYPDIKVNVEGITDYSNTALLRLQGGDWGDIMMIPTVDKKDLPAYFMSFGNLDDMNRQIKFASQWMYGGQVYGIPSTGNAQGVLYNKKVFQDAGITQLPKTPLEFIEDLKLIKTKTSAIPLYTNYAAGWTMGAWDAYIGGSATGKTEYMNSILLHEKNPFADKGDDTHAYAVYKILYDAASLGLIEDDYTTTDWEGCKGMLNRGEIGTMVLGSWAFTQMQGAGSNSQDIGYMSFPITINGKQYASSGPDYCFGINVKSSNNNQKAALVFVKWMTEKSGFAYNEGGIPIATDDENYPPVYALFSANNVEFVSDAPAATGEEDLLNKLNADSELNINNNGNIKVQKIIEHAANKDESFDDIMKDWNEEWSKAQENEKVAVK